MLLYQIQGTPCKSSPSTFWLTTMACPSAGAIPSLLLSTTQRRQSLYLPQLSATLSAQRCVKTSAPSWRKFSAAWYQPRIRRPSEEQTDSTWDRDTSTMGERP